MAENLAIQLDEDLDIIEETDCVLTFNNNKYNISDIKAFMEEKDNTIRLLFDKINSLEEQVSIINKNNNELQNLIKKWEDNNLSIILQSLPDIYINLIPSINMPYPYESLQSINLGCNELALSNYNGNITIFNKIVWEQINSLYKLNKLIIFGDYKIGAKIDNRIVSRIKNSSVTELIIQPCTDKIHESIPIIIKNLPKLSILEIIHVYNVDKIADALSSCKNSLVKICLTKCVDRNVYKIEKYCKENNIELALSY